MTLKKKKYEVMVLIIIISVLLAVIFLHSEYYQGFILKSAQKKKAESDHLTKKGKPNRLAIGDLAKVSGTINIKITPPAEFDFKSKAEILDLRKKEVNHFPQLMASEYSPMDSVFGQIKDKASWWGIKGEYFYDTGSKSIEGDSEESRFILNPFLLIAADFLGLSIWKHGDLVWDKKKITEKHLKQPDFPF